ncbi:hypothetical protein SAMN06275492_1405 [Dethiosulfovibrio salsuginis]|uniref:Uncharacterized protein n=1 Tax=Dethiosulfovibrio salsuginis TaxID=561720 RepID=A0A1X7KZL5_9BACT|nr:hypothetical protein SAMN06275492_1405 [Dethiosulfovibrio salsuginis]
MPFAKDHFLVYNVSHILKKQTKEGAAVKDSSCFIVNIIVSLVVISCRSHPGVKEQLLSACNRKLTNFRPGSHDPGLFCMDITKSREVF